MTSKILNKALKKANRDIQFDILGPGFHSTTKVHKSKKTYSRKTKHKGGIFISPDCFMYYIQYNCQNK
jgi:hypothetical protein